VSTLKPGVTNHFIFLWDILHLVYARMPIA